MKVLNGLNPGTKLFLEVVRKDKKKETIELTLGEFPGTTRGEEGTIPAKLPEVASFKKALERYKKEAKKEDKKGEKKEKAPTGLLNRVTAAGHKYWIYVPENYDPNISHAVVAWFHPAGKNRKADIEAFANGWAAFCAENNIILVGPLTNARNGWTPSDTEFVVQAIRDVLGSYRIDE